VIDTFEENTTRFYQFVERRLAEMKSLARKNVEKSDTSSFPDWRLALVFFTFLLLVGGDEKDDLTCKKSEKQKLRKMLIYLSCSKAPSLIKP
jgi:hypothetical protein